MTLALLRKPRGPEEDGDLSPEISDRRPEGQWCREVEGELCWAFKENTRLWGWKG